MRNDQHIRQLVESARRLLLRGDAAGAHSLLTQALGEHSCLTTPLNMKPGTTATNHADPIPARPAARTT
jgi:hypothetical protein